MLQVFITSPGRCGSSLLAEFCRRMNYDPGGEWCAKTDCGREDLDVRRIQGLLDSSNTKAAQQIAISQIRSLKRSVIKDCSLFSHPQFLATWYAAIPSLHYVVTWRDPTAQWRSWGRKLEIEGFPNRWQRDWPLEKWLLYVEQRRRSFIQSAAALQIPVRWLNYPDFCTDLPVVLRAISPPLLMSRQRAREVWADLIDLDKIHCEEPLSCTSPASAQPTAAPA